MPGGVAGLEKKHHRKWERVTTDVFNYKRAMRVG